MNAKKSEEANLKEAHLSIIMASVCKAHAKHGQKELMIPKEYLITKIADFLQISPAQAHNYLKILDSRGLVRIDKENVIYASEKSKNEQLDIEEFFTAIKKK